MGEGNTIRLCTARHGCRLLNVDIRKLEIGGAYPPTLINKRLTDAI